MKSVLMYANEDSGAEARFQAALDMVRLFDGHLICLQATPFDAFIMGDPFGGVYASSAIMDQIRKTDEEHRARLEERLRREGVSWDWLHFDGVPAQLIVDRSRLSDLIVLSLPTEGVAHNWPLSLTADVAIHARAPVLAMPQGSLGVDWLGPVMVAWNGGQEASHALRLAVPLLQKASTVHVVTVAEDPTEFPATYACLYLARHGIDAELRDWPLGGRSMSDALIDAASALGASYVLMGAYGHSRFREAVLGGTTRDMLRHSAVPLLLAH